VSRLTSASRCELLALTGSRFEFRHWHVLASTRSRGLLGFLLKGRVSSAAMRPNSQCDGLGTAFPREPRKMSKSAPSSAWSTWLR
jgi:hypothetical protein